MIDVTCAIILKDGRILAVQRSEVMSHPLEWEFPGGKVEAGECEEACILRELREELHIEVKIQSRLPFVEYHYGDKSIRLIPFVVELISDQIVLREHAGFRWMLTDQLLALNWLPADILVINEYLRLKK